MNYYITIVSIAMTLPIISCSIRSTENVGPGVSVSKMCTDENPFSNVVNFLAKGIKKPNSALLPRLMKQVLNPDSGKMKPGYSFEDCRVTENGDLSFNVMNEEGQKNYYYFEGKGPKIVEFSPNVERPSPGNTLTCQSKKLTHYVLVIQDESASYEQASTNQSIEFRLNQTDFLKTYRSSNCTDSKENFTMNVGMSDLSIYFTVENNKDDELVAKTGGNLPPPTKQKVFGAATSPTEIESDPAKDTQSAEVKAPEAEHQSETDPVKDTQSAEVKAPEAEHQSETDPAKDTSGETEESEPEEDKAPINDSSNVNMYYCLDQNLIGFGNFNLSNVLAETKEEADMKILNRSDNEISDEEYLKGVDCQKIEVPLEILKKVEMKYRSDFPEHESSTLLIKGEKKSFSNGCLDVPEPEEICTYAFVDGYAVSIANSIDGVSYHLNLDASVIRKAFKIFVAQ